MTTLTLGPTVSAATFLTGLADETYDTIELTAGSYANLHNLTVNIDRVLPITVKPATGAVVILDGSAGTGSGEAFVFGFGGSASFITLQDLIFQDYDIAATGVIWVGNANNITLNRITVQTTVTHSPGSPTLSWALYLSSDAGVAASDIVADDWTVTGSGRNHSGLQLYGTGTHTNINADGWVCVDLAFALIGQSTATGVSFDDWTITDCGGGSYPSSVFFGDSSGAIVGTYSGFNLVASDPIVNEGAGMVAGGGGSESPIPDLPPGPASNETFLYRTPTTPAGPGWVEEIPIRLGSISGVSQEAELAAVGVSQISIDDPDADVGHASDAILGLKQFDWIEAAASVGHRRIWTGYIGDRTYRRGSGGESPSLITGSARLIDATLSDINSFLTFRLLGVDATSAFDRSAETDVQRITALLGVDFLSTTLKNGLVSTANPKPMDAVNYEDQTPAEVINDCCQQSGKNAFVWYDEAGTYTPSPGQFGLFYDFNSSLVFPAATNLAVSNVLADIDLDSDDLPTGPVWGPAHDAQLIRDPSRVVAGVKLRYANGSVYVNNLATSYQFGYRDMLVDAPNVKTESAALARANRILAENSTEDDRLSFTLWLPAAHVNDWMAGQYAPVRFTHLPGYDVEGGVNVRALSRTVTQDHETQEFYWVHYEATPMIETIVSCSTALGQIIVASATGSNFTSGNPTAGDIVTPSVDIEPDSGAPCILFSYIATVAGDAPTDHLMTTPSGYTLLEEFNSTTGQAPELPSDINVSTPRVLSYKAVASPSGTYTAANQYAKGYGTSAWLTLQVALPTAETAPVQSSETIVVAGATIDAHMSAPVVGNMIVAFVTSNDPSVSVVDPAQSGWTVITSNYLTQPYSDPPDNSRHRRVNVYVRCYDEGEGQEPDGTVWRFSWPGGSSGCSVFLSEWAIS